MRGLVLVVALLAGCFNDRHVSIAPLPPAMTPDQRVRAYAKYARNRDLAMSETYCRRASCETEQVLLLGDGTQVREVEDVLPLLPDDSTAARAARRARDKKSWFKRFFVLGGLVMAGGFAVMAKSDVEDTEGYRLKGGVIFLGGIALVGVAIAYRMSAKTSREEVRAHYSQDLAAGLSVCVNGLAIVPCEGGPGLSLERRDEALDELPQR